MSHMIHMRKTHQFYNNQDLTSDSQNTSQPSEGIELLRYKSTMSPDFWQARLEEVPPTEGNREHSQVRRRFDLEVGKLYSTADIIRFNRIRLYF